MLSTRTILELQSYLRQTFGEEKIRECTMRLDGMAMSTQWVRMHHDSDGNDRLTFYRRTLR